MQQDTSGFKWKLANATTTTEGTKTYYTYELEYTVTLDADHPGFEEGKLYPLNGETYIAMPDGNKVKFPVPGATGIKTRYTVTYTDGVDGEVVFEDKVFNVVVGSSTPGFGGTPTRAGYTFTGWSRTVAERRFKDASIKQKASMRGVPYTDVALTEDQFRNLFSIKYSFVACEYLIVIHEGAYRLLIFQSFLRRSLSGTSNSS